MVRLEHGRQRGGLLLPLVLVLVATLSTGQAVSAQRAATSSPASGHGEVIAQGVATMPKAPVGWRVLEIEAKPPEDAPVAERSLGFVLADEREVLVTNEAGERTLLAPGEALLTQQGAEEQRASTDNHPVAYYALELVVAADLENEATIGDGELLFIGDDFSAPKGDRDLNMVRDVLDKGEATEIRGAQGPVLVLVTAGKVEVSGDDDEATLTAGEAVVLKGDVSLEAARNGSVFVAATIGERVEATGGQTTARPTAQTEEAGSFSVTTYACPEGMTIESLDPEACGESEDTLVSWSLAGDEIDTLGQVDAEQDGATTTWTGLPAGEYFLDLSAETYAPGYGDYFIPSSDQVTRQNENTTRIYFDSARSTGDVQAYVFPTAEPEPQGSVSISVEIHNCPAGTPLENIQVEPCTEPLGETLIVLSGSALPYPRSLLDATGDGPAPTWTSLPYGEYCLVVSNFESGHDTIYVFGDAAPATVATQAGGTALVCWAMPEDGASSAYVYLYIVDSEASTPPDDNPEGDGERDADTDMDGIPDSDEVALGTDPESADTDGGGVEDPWEFEYGTDPTDPDDYPIG